MKSLMLITLFLSLFIYSFSTLCSLITGDLVNKANCINGEGIFNFTCCYEVTTYQNNQIKTACAHYIKNKTLIDIEIRQIMALYPNIKNINVDCSSFFLKTCLFILLLLF